MNTSVARVTKDEPMMNEDYTRRFELADLSEHGAWMMPRLLVSFPKVGERQMAGFLSSNLYNSEISFMYSKNAIGFAQILRTTTLQSTPVVWEKFVFCRDPANAEHHAEALSFYMHWARWAKHQGADTIVLLQQSDVPPELVQKAFGRLLKTEQFFVKV